MKALHHTCQGASHLATHKVCQDASWSRADGGAAIAIVCDGHGGERYFRSDTGARTAVEAARLCVETFVREADPRLFAGKPLTAKRAVASEADEGRPTKDTPADKALRQLFSSIIYAWRTGIERHARLNPLTQHEREAVPPRYTAAFESGQDLEKTYGCTLMCYVCTPAYWIAFHIGDGKCIAFGPDARWSEPVPWDERCFLNKTTSLCDSAAIDEFRYCYADSTHRPLAVCLGSDGMDDSFGETENLVNFYAQVLKLLAREGRDSALLSLSDTLPELSRIGSKDDMSVAIVYDEHALPAALPLLTAWQRNRIGEQICRANRRILHLRQTIEACDNADTLSERQAIDRDYAQKELTRAYAGRRSLTDKWNRLARELSGPAFTPWHDAIGEDVEHDAPQTEHNAPQTEHNIPGEENDFPQTEHDTPQTEYGISQTESEAE